MYKIYCIEDINGLKYVGITKQKLNTRLTRHRYAKKNNTYCSSSKLDLDNCEMILLEETNDPKREQYWINKIDCINDRNATYDKNEYMKQYYIDNKDKKNQYEKQRREYQNSWGGRPDTINNSLLKIDIDYFNS